MRPSEPLKSLAQRFGGDPNTTGAPLGLRVLGASVGLVDLWIEGRFLGREDYGEEVPAPEQYFIVETVSR